MSHFKERKEKDCLNCGAEIQGLYCHNCGQENIEPKESFIHLLGHLVAHEFHFDSKFFSTVKHLFLSPGFLTKEYMRGKRASYLDPIRMYIFLSAFFFLVVFSFNKTGHHLKVGPANTDTKKEAINAINEIKKAIVDSLNDEGDSLDSLQKETLKQRAAKLDRYENILKKDSANTDSIVKLFAEKDAPDVVFLGPGRAYKSLEEYDSVQKALPKNKRDNSLVHAINRKGYEVLGKFKSDPTGFIDHLQEEFFHSFSEIFFISLPFFALILQLLYLRNRKNYYYVNHFVYTLHLYSGTFFIGLVIYLVKALKEASGWHWLNYFTTLLVCYWVYYSYKSLRTFYGQSRGKTLLKFFLLSIASLVLFIFLIVIFLVISAYKA
jgi:hypothetical protein